MAEKFYTVLVVHYPLEQGLKQIEEKSYDESRKMLVVHYPLEQGLKLAETNEFLLAKNYS